jgi:hypothetical protein
MTSEKKFYVYIHRKATDGSVFYVGKGQGKRAYWVHNRNTRWHRTVIKYGFTSHIVMMFEREECAYSFECALIKFYGRENLCNATDGGLGIYGFIFTKETRDKMSKSHSGIKHHMFGKKHSTKSLDKMSQSTPKKKVSCSNGLVFDSAKMASKWIESIGLSINAQGNISSCARGDRKYAYGFTWKYV